MTLVRGVLSNVGRSTSCGHQKKTHYATILEVRYLTIHPCSKWAKCIISFSINLNRQGDHLLSLYIPTFAKTQRWNPEFLLCWLVFVKKHFSQTLQAQLVSWLLTLIEPRACSSTLKNVNATGERCTNVTDGSARRDQLPQRGNTPQTPRTILNYSTQKHTIVLQFIFITQRNGSSCCSSLCPARGRRIPTFSFFYKTTEPSAAKKAAHRSRVCAIKQFGHGVLYQRMWSWMHLTSLKLSNAFPSHTVDCTAQFSRRYKKKKKAQKAQKGLWAACV